MQSTPSCCVNKALLPAEQLRHKFLVSSLERLNVGFPTKTYIFLICFEQKGLEEQTQINKTILSHVKLCKKAVNLEQQYLLQAAPAGTQGLHAWIPAVPNAQTCGEMVVGRSLLVCDDLTTKGAGGG